MPSELDDLENALGSSAPQSPALGNELDALDGAINTQADQVKQLAQSPQFLPLSYAAPAVADDGTVDQSNPNFQLAKQVQDYRTLNKIDPTNPSFGQKVQSAGKGLLQFVEGAPLAAKNLVQEGYDAVTGDAASEAKHGTMAMAGGQEAESGLSHMVDAVVDPIAKLATGGRAPLTDDQQNWMNMTNVWRDSNLRRIDNNDNLSDDQKSAAKQHIQDAYDSMVANAGLSDNSLKKQFDTNEFARKVAENKNSAGLQSGQVQNTGLLAGAVSGTTGQKPSQLFASPETLSDLGQPLTPSDTNAIAAMGTAANPGNIAFEFAPQIPGVGAALKLGGKATQAVSEAGLNAIQNTTVGKVAAGAIGAGAVMAAAKAVKEGHTGDLLAPALVGLALVSGKYGGQLAGDAGTLASGGALAEGTNPLYLRAAQTVAGTAGGAAFGAGQAALSGDDVTEGALSGAAMGAFGGATGSTRPLEQAASAQAMQDFGAKLRTGNQTIDAAHDATMAKFDPQDQDAINRLRAHLYTANPVNLVVLDAPSFVDAAKNAGMQGSGNGPTGTERGAFTTTDPYAVSADGRTIFLNADALGGSGAVDTAGHEVGHAVVDWLQRAGKAADAADLYKTIESALTPDDVQAIRSKYTESWKHAEGVDDASIAAAPADQQDALRQRAQQIEGAPNPVDENIAEITRNILSGRDISSYALPKPLTEKIGDAAANFFESAGISPGFSKEQGMKFNTWNIHDAARQLNDALYSQGAAARQARSGDQNATAGGRLQQVYQELGGLLSTPPGQRPSDAPQRMVALTRERDALEGQLQAPQPAQTAPNTPPPQSTPSQGAGGGAAGQPGGAPAFGNAPETPKNTPEEPFSDIGLTQAQVDAVRDSYISPEGDEPKTIRSNSRRGIPGKSADQVAEERGQEWDKMFSDYVDYLRDNGYQSFQNPAEIRQAVIQHSLRQDAPAFSPASVPTPLPKSEAPQPEIPATSRISKKQGEAKPAFAPGPAPEAPDAGEISQRAKQAESDLRASPEFARKRKVSTRDAAVKEARTQAILDAADESTGGDTSLLQKRKLPDGSEIYSGKLDLTVPAHKALADELGLSAATQSTIDRANDNIGKTVYLDYKSAPKTSKDISGAQRAEELEASPAEERKKGAPAVEQKGKAFYPLGFQVFPSGGVVLRGLSPDKWITNAGKLMSHMRGQGIATGYDGINDPQLVADMQGYARNHGNGYLGDGSAPVADETAKGTPYQIPRDRFNILNAALNMDQSTKIDSPRKGARESALEAQYRAAENNWPVDQDTGDTNPLRALINKSGQFVSQNTEGKTRAGTGDHLEPVVENISPDLITAIRGDPADKQEIVRPVGFQGNPGAAFAEGAPRSDYARSGFMPDSGDDQTGAPEFKKWFGESKVKDENGKPLVVYKGMYPHDWTKETKTDKGPLIDSIQRTTDFPAFNSGEKDVPNVAGFFGDLATANRFAAKDGSVYPVYLSLENPYEIDAKGEKAGKMQFGESGKPFRDAMRSGKYDGAIIKNTADEGTIYITSKASQAKSAIANNGAFNASDPRLSFMPASDDDLLRTAESRGFKMKDSAAASGEQMVNVKVPEFDKAWSKDGKDFYIPPGGGGAEIGGRREGVKDFINRGLYSSNGEYTPRTMEVPRVSYNDGIASFTDGRHRFSTLRDAGASHIPVSMHEDSLERARADGLIDDESPIGQLTPEIPATSIISKKQGAFMPMDVFHGSPHRIEDAMSTEKIGSGEGAQAYGWGLYFADNKETAMSYWPRESGMEDKLLKEYNSAIDKGDYDSAELWEAAMLHHLPSDITSDKFEHIPQSKREAVASKLANILKKAKGGIYKAILDVEPSELLDWDKPLSDQSENVKIGLAKIDPDLYDLANKDDDAKSLEVTRKYISPKLTIPASADVLESMGATPEELEPVRRVERRGWNEADPTEMGSSIYNRISNSPKAKTPKEASELLAANGIPGITYRDQESRNNGEGTRNHVIFDASKVKILSRNEIPLKSSFMPSSQSDNKGAFADAAPPRDTERIAAFAESPAPKKEKPKDYGSAREVHQAFRNKEIDAETATNILKNQFGME